MPHRACYYQRTDEGVEMADDETPDELELDSQSVVDELLREDIIEVMAGLSPRERDVVRLRFGLDDGQQRTLADVALFFGTTKERIRQIEANALRKLRNPNRTSRRASEPNK